MPTHKCSPRKNEITLEDFAELIEKGMLSPYDPNEP